MATAHRASILHFLADPDQVAAADVYQYFADGLLLIDEGKVSALGQATDLLPTLAADIELIEHPNSLLLPGFVDTHIHYPQTEMIASYGESLLPWLNKYTFPTEAQFADEDYAGTIAELFLTELLRAGTTTALVFGTVHKQSIDAFFTACSSKNLRMIAGKAMMDRNAPDNLLDTAESSYHDSKALIEKWHKHGRLQYAVTPRFAGTSTEQQLAKAGQLLTEFPDVYLQSHIAENVDEVAWIESLFPQRKNYLDCYDHAGLLGRRSILAHGIHLKDEEWQRLAASETGIAFCPSSNLFLGSGLFPLSTATKHKVNVGLGTDIGAGTSFSLLQTLNDAYKVLQLRGETLSPLKSFYLATLGGATTLDLQDVIGNFGIGKEADFVVIDKSCTPFIDYRLRQCQDLFEQLFVLSMLGDDRAIAQTWAAGVLVHQRQP
ncbi:guanine deaminase [Oceanicoccus sp. KOV_DT_Chl]|uniref:guanine deaminase n=1 Tax=Oceanicoccus sp. KOV_DT_Chl TaxID=1904639 RepID=UPI000C7A36B3|nr:guanine deaminase [Oceanicoccus sp. KOV_DT_Chl]